MLHSGSLAIGEPVHGSAGQTTWQITAIEPGTPALTIKAKCLDGREISYTAAIHVDPIAVVVSPVVADPSPTAVPERVELAGVVEEEVAESPTPVVVMIAATPTVVVIPTPALVTLNTPTPSATATAKPTSLPDIPNPSEDEAVVMTNPAGQGPDQEGPVDTDAGDGLPVDQGVSSESSDTSWLITLLVTISIIASLLILVVLITIALLAIFSARYRRRFYLVWMGWKRQMRSLWTRVLSRPQQELEEPQPEEPVEVLSEATQEPEVRSVERPVDSRMVIDHSVGSSRN